MLAMHAARCWWRWHTSYTGHACSPVPEEVAHLLQRPCMQSDGDIWITDSVLQGAGTNGTAIWLTNWNLGSPRMWIEGALKPCRLPCCLAQLTQAEPMRHAVRQSLLLLSRYRSRVHMVSDTGRMPSCSRVGDLLRPRLTQFVTINENSACPGPQ